MSATQWKSADGKFTFDKTGTDLTIKITDDAEGTIVLKDFKDGDPNIQSRQRLEEENYFNEIKSLHNFTMKPVQRFASAGASQYA